MLQILDMTFELFDTSSSIRLRRVDSKILLLINWELPPPGEKWLLKRTSPFVGSHKRGNLESITILIMIGGALTDRKLLRLRNDVLINVP